MADEMKMNFKALKRVDPYIERIEDFATQVALYKYASSEWEKLDIEGTLFVNRRQDDPKYGFIILNRLSDKNLVEPVTKELDFQVHTPFLLYKNKEGSIFGIWFFDPKECERIHKKMESCVKIVEKRLGGGEGQRPSGEEDNIIALLQKASVEEKKTAGSSSSKARKSNPPPEGSSPHINNNSRRRNHENEEEEEGDKLLQLLSGNSGNKSAEEFKQKKKDEPHKRTLLVDEKPPASKEEDEGSTGNSVADFFAKASKSDSAFSTPLLTSSAGPPAFSPGGVLHHHPLMPHLPPVSGGPVSMIPFQGFHGHPVHVPVALHQSWQQQAPHPPPQHNGQSSTPTTHTVNDPAATQRLFSIPGSYPVEMIERSQRGDSGASTPHFTPITPQGGGGKAPPPEKATPKVVLPPPIKGLSEPELMSPMAFAHNPGGKKLKKKETTAPSTVDTNSSSLNGLHLNEGQLVQALKHLLAHDSSFVSKLHKAYLEVAARST